MLVAVFGLYSLFGRRSEMLDAGPFALFLIFWACFAVLIALWSTPHLIRELHDSRRARGSQADLALYDQAAQMVSEAFAGALAVTRAAVDGNVVATSLGAQFTEVVREALVVIGKVGLHARVPRDRRERVDTYVYGHYDKRLGAPGNVFPSLELEAFQEDLAERLTDRDSVSKAAQDLDSFSIELGEQIAVYAGVVCKDPQTLGKMCLAIMRTWGGVDTVPATFLSLSTPFRDSSPKAAS